MNTQPRLLRANASYQLGNLVAVNLPKQQAKTLLLCADGRSEKEAAQALSCSPKNISQLKNALFNRFNVHSASELIVKAFQFKHLQFLNAYAALQTTAPQTIEIPAKGNRP